MANPGVERQTGNARRKGTHEVAKPAGRPHNPGMRCITTLLVLATLFATPAAGDVLGFFRGGHADQGKPLTPCAFESIPTARPHRDPTLISIGVRVLDIIAVDDVRQQATLDFVLYAHWRDARLSNHLDAKERCTLPLGAVWNPNLQLLGERDIQRRFPEMVVVAPDGVTMHQRLHGTLRATSDLRAFPFDERVLGIRFVAVGLGPKQVEFRPVPERMGLEPNRSVTDWDFVSESTVIATYDVPEMKASFASFEYQIAAERRSSTIVQKLGIPLVLIVLMSWIPFWLDFSILSARLSIASLAMLNAIAYQLVLRSSLPPVPYLTSADWASVCALLLVFLALLENAIAGILEMRDRTTIARSLDVFSRLAFPALTVLGLWFSIP
jgi:hypothetical protein